MEPLADAHGRKITDLRISVTDRCNFRCRYCMPAEGMRWLDRSDLLSFEEIARLAGVLAGLGITDVRLTGGEPLARRDFPALVGMLRPIEGIRDLSMTTNGYLLERDAAALVEAGIDRVNVSIDSLARDRFHEVTRRDALPQVLRGLEAIAAFERVRPIKVNAVAMRDFTEDEVFRFCELARSTDYQVRFIEFMPLDGDRAWSPDQVLTGDEIRDPDRDPPPTARAASRAARHGARLRVRRRTRGDRVHQPGLGAVLRATATGFASPPRASCGPACSLSARPTCASRCEPAPATTSSSESIRDAVWRKELKHRVNEPGFVPRRGR